MSSTTTLMSAESRAIVVQDITSQYSICFSLSNDGLTIKEAGSKLKVPIVVAHRNILRAHVEDNTHTLQVAYMVKNIRRKHTSLVEVKGELGESKIANAKAWAESVMQAVYDNCGVERSRRLKVLVNPHGGTKKGETVFRTVVEPIFRAAGCSLDVILTTHRGHAHDIAKSLSLDYDAIVAVSGDGLIHEVLNGFAQHPDPLKAFSIPIAPIPTGSGNGLSLNLLGIDSGFDVGAAALNVIKGQPMKVDLFSISQNGKRAISFMSQALGLMADLDIGTEHLRWMGDVRFMYGLIRGIIQFKACPVQLSFKIAEKDKVKMAEIAFNNRKSKATANIGSPISTLSEDIGNALPPLKYLPEDNEGWTTFEEPLVYVYAGKGPYVGRDYMAFPVSLPDDGLIDVIAMPLSSRKDIISGMEGAPRGDFFWHSKVHYVKAHAYRVKPLKPTGHLAVDGEIFPFEEFQVEVHQSLGTFLSPHGHYAVDFSMHKHLKLNRR